MKKLIFLPTLLFLSVGGLAFAQGQENAAKAGITPENPFYFLDRFGETVREFFTFNPEGKAKLQITFAAERVAEIKFILEGKGVEAKGLDVAQSRFQAHLAKAAAVVNEQKAEGKDVSVLASELDDELETPKTVLAQTFKEQKRALKQQEKELKAQLKATHVAGDTTQEEAIAAQLGQVKAQLELLELREDDIEQELEAEEERIEEAMEAEHKAEKAIREAEEEKEEILEEAAEEGVELPQNAFAEFDNLLSQAQAAFGAENFQEARQLAKQAEESLEEVEEAIEELEEQQELREGAQEAIDEAEEESAEIVNEARKEGIVVSADVFDEFSTLFVQAKNAFEAGNYQEAKRLAEQAEDALEDVKKATERLEAEEEQEEQGEEGESEDEEEEQTPSRLDGRKPGGIIEDE